MTSVLRPDERASMAANESDERLGKKIKGVAKTVGTLGLAAGALPAAFSRIVPFLSELIPADIAMKGISKISPKIGEYLNRVQKSGLPVEEGLKFLKDNINQEPKEQAKTSEPPKESRNIIEQYSPNLNSYLKEMIGAGNTPAQAAVKARKWLTKKEKDLINKIEKDHKTDWISIVESIFGGQSKAALQPQQAEQQNPINQSQAQQQAPQEQQSQPMQQQQTGPGQQMLMQVLQKINSKIGM